MADLFILPGSPAHADVRPGATAVDVIHRTIASLRGQEITLLTFFPRAAGVEPVRERGLRSRPQGRAERLETDARDEIVALQAETDRLKSLLLSGSTDPRDLGRGVRGAGSSRRYRYGRAGRRP